MPRGNSNFFVWLLIGAIFLIVLNAVWLHWRPHSALGSSWGARLLSGSAQLHGIITSITHWHQLADENNQLKGQLAEQVSAQASISELQRQNQQLRAALDLPSHGKREIIPGGIYDISLSPDGYTALVNQGSNHQVALGDLVVGDHNILLGIVSAVFADSARVTLLSDPTFKVTVQVLGSSVKGIAHGALGKGLNLDLVVQTDDIHEGDTLISSGDDMVPGGLVVGTVTHVESNNAKLFKQVSVTPAAQFITGDAFIIKP